MNFFFGPIKLLEFFVCLSDSQNVKHSLEPLLMSFLVDKRSLLIKVVASIYVNWSKKIFLGGIDMSS